MIFCDRVVGEQLVPKKEKYNYKLLALFMISCDRVVGEQFVPKKKKGSGY